MAGGRPTAATPPLKFGSFRADPAGNDLPMSTAKLNGEYIVVTNTTSRAIVMTGYKVYDAGKKHTYAFPKGYAIAGRKSVVLRTGSGRNTARTSTGARPTPTSGTTPATPPPWSTPGAKVARLHLQAGRRRDQGLLTP